MGSSMPIRTPSLARYQVSEENKTLDYRLATTVSKAPQTNLGMTPLHCAAIIPDTTMLKRFFTFSNGTDFTDDSGWTLAHYAATCKTDDPLKFLIKNNFALNNGDNEGVTPLMVAARLGRYHNVVALIEAYGERQERKKKQAEEEEKKREESMKKKEKKSVKKKPVKRGKRALEEEEEE